MPEPLFSRPAATELDGLPKICLNMIVKDESAVIERALASVEKVIDYFVIVDTGSSDATPGLIVEFMQARGVPGEVHFRDWVNFGHNRQQALELAVGHGDWLLFIDADEELRYDDPGFRRRLKPGTSYWLTKHYGSLRYELPQLIWLRNTSWHWAGAVHEYLVVADDHPRRSLTAAWVVSHVGEGARSRRLSQEQKFLQDARLLEEELRRNPDDARNQFYLAQSYRDAGYLGKAYKHYERRVAMGGWEEEVYVAQCEKALLAVRRNMGHREIVAEHLHAYRLRPSRAEALYQLASYCRERKLHAEGYLFAKVGKDIPMPADILFLRRDVYEWRLLDEFAVCAYWIGQYRESADASRRLLDEGRHEPADRERLEKNLGFALAGLK